MHPILSPAVFAAVWLAALEFTSPVLAAESVPTMPMPIPAEATATHRWLQKPVLAARRLDDMERTNQWTQRGPGTMSLTTARAHQGRHALRLTAPTKTDAPPRVKGRPFGETAARRSFAGEDWTGFNRVSFWVYPHLPGFQVISMLVKLHNEGAPRVPDAYGREGLNFVLLQPDTWNHVVWEITHLARDQVSALELIYRLQGNEPGATNVVCFDFDQLELQRVEPDHFEGWNVAPGQLAFSHSGYLPGWPKIALASGLAATEFSVIARDAGKVLLKKRIELRQAPTGEFQALDFSEVKQPGVYRLEAGPVRTAWFPIGPDVWDSSLWKTINFFYCERCGDRVPGIHEVCHADWQARHGDKTIGINGGWHDAGDLSQGLVNTAEATAAMFTLAERLLPRKPALARRLIEEARWGLEWIHKTRFADGFRVTWATMDYWTDGVLGTVDDTLGDVRDSAFDVFQAAAAEAVAARVLADSDAPLAARSLELARQDWQFATARSSSTGLELAAAGAQAALELFKATREAGFADRAIEFAAIILACQQREEPAWTIPLTGFFYTHPKRERILHYAHRGHEQAPVVALVELCEAFPAHPQRTNWFRAVELHSTYLQRVAQWTEPYGMLCASIYTMDESRDPRFREQVTKGIQLAEKHYLRRFPVWFDFRGNAGTVLSQARALSAASRLRRDRAGMALALKQLEWAVGRNPFCQSLMYGEGHDYAPQYTAMSGDLAGSLPVGIQTRENNDLPYWPAANCYNYKEVWVHPSSRWLAILGDVLTWNDALDAAPAE